MTTLSIHQRPAPVIAAAVACAALAVGAVAVSLVDRPGHPGAPGGQTQISSHQNAPKAHTWHPTTSGGHVMLGE
jgi:hypothetical protein